MKMAGYSKQEEIVNGDRGYIVVDILRIDVAVERLAVRFAVYLFVADPKLKPVPSRESGVFGKVLGTDNGGEDAHAV